MSGSNVTHTPIAGGGIGLSLDETQSLVGTKIGEYRLIELLGRGGAGEVYLAEHEMIYSRVAIKILRPEIASSNYSVRRFLLEAQAANQIQSPHIVPVSDFGSLPDGRPYAIMEFLQGMSLDQLIREEAPLDLVRVAALLKQVADGIQAAHEAKIIHRDLKPANLFVVPNENYRFGLVRILDFGVAKFVPTSHDYTLTQHAGPMGTPRYAAPEQLNGGTVDSSCDVYALGTIAYEMLCGHTPFSGEPTDVITNKIVNAPKHLRELKLELPREFCDFVMRMIARRPDDRVRTMQEVYAFLSAPEKWGRSHSASQKKRAQVLAIAAATLALVLGASWMAHYRSGDSTNNLETTTIQTTPAPEIVPVQKPESSVQPETSQNVETAIAPANNPTKSSKKKVAKSRSADGVNSEKVVSESKSDEPASAERKRRLLNPFEEN